MADRRTSRESLESVWRQFGRNLAVAAGALTALCSLMFHVPVWVASMRGAIVFAGLLFVNSVSCAVLSSVETRGAAKRPASATRRTP
jgi:hypothetical protein